MSYFSDKSLNYVSRLFDIEKKLEQSKNWILPSRKFSFFLHVVDGRFTVNTEKIIKACRDVTNTLGVNHQLIKKVAYYFGKTRFQARMQCIIYVYHCNLTAILLHFEQPKEAYLLLSKNAGELSTLVTYTSSFRYKLLNNLLLLNKKLFRFGKSNVQLCPLCILHNERVTHIFYDC